MLDRFLNPQMTSIEESKGNLGLSYKNIYTKINMVMKSTTLTRINHTKAARLLYISKGVQVKDNSFGTVVIGGLDVLVIYDDYGEEGYNRLYDLAYLENHPVLFIYHNAMFNKDLPFGERFSNLYMLYLELVTLSMVPGLTFMPASIYGTIAKYAPLVLTVKTMAAMGERCLLEDINMAYIPQTDWSFITEEMINAIHSIQDMTDMLTYGALCDYVKDE